MIELVKQEKPKETLDFLFTQKGALILNEYYELNNYFGEKSRKLLTLQLPTQRTISAF